MPQTKDIPDRLLEPDGIYQNRIVSCGVKVRQIGDGAVRIAVSDSRQECVALLDDSERRHLIALLAACAG